MFAFVSEWCAKHQGMSQIMWQEDLDNHKTSSEIWDLFFDLIGFVLFVIKSADKSWTCFIIFQKCILEWWSLLLIKLCSKSKNKEEKQGKKAS